MRTLYLVAIGLGLTVAACSSGSYTAPPNSPSRLPSPAPTPPRLFAFAEPYTSITLGDVVHARVGADDPVCDQWHCQYFRVTVPRDGRLEVVMTFIRGNLDVSVTDSAGRESWDPRPLLPDVRVSVQATGGATYQIAIWEYEFPGVEFELRSSLQ